MGLVLILGVSIGAGPPEPVRVQVPAARIEDWFPRGTELRGMAAGPFETLVRDARAGYRRQDRRTAPRLLRARHVARWEEGVLIGRSELSVEPAESGPSNLVLDPWSPAIEPGRAGSERLRANEEGRSAIRIDPSGPATIALEWQLRARGGSQGRGFSLELPAADVSSLTLDLPEVLVPEGPGGLRPGPTTGGAEGRASWRFDGRGGKTDLRLRDRGESEGRSGNHRPWVSGPTRIELTEGAARWTTEWSVTLDARGSRRFSFELDPGLELIDVTGSGVEETTVQPSGSATTVSVVLSREVLASASMIIRATAKVPEEGPWAVPAARPLDALWTGGTTTIRLDPGRVVRDCHEESGRRISARTGGEPADASTLGFEAIAPRSVATLTFCKPWADVSAEVRGQVLLGNAAPRLEAQIAWRVHRGQPLRFDVDLPPAWVPDLVQVAGIDEPVLWHPEVMPGGEVRVHVVPPSVSFTRGPLVLRLEASSTIAGGQGPISLPRVRPVGVRIADELWLAWAEPRLTVQPTSARGLAWIDPRIVPGSSPRRLEAPAGMHQALAWRWILDRAEARVERERVEVDPTGSVRLTATVGQGRLRLDWRIAVEAGAEPLRSIPFALIEPIEGAADWRFHDEATDLELARRPIDDGRRADEGLPESGPAWMLELPYPRPGRVAIRSHLELPWSGTGRVPLIVLPGRFHAGGLVLVEVERGTRSTAQASALRTLDPAAAGEVMGDDGDSASGPSRAGLRRAHAFGYDGPDGRLELTTEDLQPSRIGGVIAQAVLTSSIDPGGSSRHRLTLRVATDRSRPLGLDLPDGATLVRVRRDGQAVTPIQAGRSLTIPLPATTGSRPLTTVTLDYQDSRSPLATVTALRPFFPTSTLPCLRFRWEVLTPTPWELSSTGPGLVGADPSPTSSWMRWLLDSRSAWGLASPSPSRGEAAMLQALDERVAATRPEEATLGEWFTRWDGGAWPLVIDQMTLSSAGWGPKSRVVPPRVKTGQREAARASLRALGLTVVPVGGVLLITTTAEDPERPGGPLQEPGARIAWESALREASAWGTDPSDRFHSVAYWRGEITPKPLNPDEREPVDEGWRIWRFAASGWPDPGASIALLDGRRRAAEGWTAGLAVVALGIAVRGLGRPRRVAGLTFLTLGSLLMVLATSGRPSLVPLGVLGGSIAVLFLWLGLALPRRTRGRFREPRPSSSTRSRVVGARATLLVVLGIAAVTTSARLARAQLESEGAFIALFPYEGVPDPARAPDRVVLRLDDYERLKALSERGREERTAGLAATTATHRVSWRDDRDVLVETDWDLDCESPAAWRFPVEETRDVSASLDGDEVPVRIEPGGRVATVLVSGTGRHRLNVRRVATPRRSEVGESLSLPIPPMVSARLVVADSPEGRRIELPGARGRVEPRGTGAEATLGPVDRLDVRWIAGAGDQPTTPVGAVDSLFLWDAEPAGDHVRARLTYRNPAGTSSIRIGLEPGLVIRPGPIPGQMDAVFLGTPDHPEWVARVDPPLPDGTTIALEFWRPGVSKPPGTSDEAPVRTLPRIEPLGIERLTAALAFRRPSDWSGRLSAGAGAGVEAMTEEAFVRSWGNLPDEPLTLSGAVRLTRWMPVSLDSGPPPDRVRVGPTVQVAIASGRVESKLEADLTEMSGLTDEVEIETPADFRVAWVEADGLTDWSRLTDRVRLRFDGLPARQRKLRLFGWVPVPPDPLATDPIGLEVGVPWLRSVDAESRPGTLTITSAAPFQLDAGPGVVLINPGPAAGATSGPLMRKTYRVDRPEDLGRLRWEVEPPRVGVQVLSRLTVHPDSAEWVAVLRYDVSAGASNAVHLRLPTAWASQARVEVMGEGHALTAESRGAMTTWMIRPDRPIWGTCRLVVRSAVPLPGRAALAFPELYPLGRGGATDTYLAIANASGRELAIEGSPGLQPMEDRSRFRDDAFAGQLGATSRVFHVITSPGWTLKVQPLGEPGREARRISLTDLSCTLRPDGSALGSARYEVEPHAGPFLPITLPVGAEPIWATADGTPALPMRSASGRWLIPLPGGDASQVGLIWRTPSTGRESRTNRLVPLPESDEGRGPILVTVHAPDSIALQSPSPSFQQVGPEGLEIARAEWQGQRVSELIGKIDRSSLRDRETLVSELVRFDLRLRAAERASVAGGGTLPVVERLRQVRDRSRGARAALTEAVESAGFDEFAGAAEVHLGRAADDLDGTAVAIPEPITPVRVSPLGRPLAFQGEWNGPGPPPTIAWSIIPSRSLFARPELWALALATLAVPPLASLLVRRRGRAGRLALAALPPALAVVAVVGGPWALVAALGMTALGRFS
jgi:hypothetical protein